MTVEWESDPDFAEAYALGQEDGGGLVRRAGAFYAFRVRAILLFLSLQQPSDRVVATAADTAFVRDQLTRGVAELAPFPAGKGLAGEASAFSILDFRYTQQFHLWRLRAEGTAAVLRIDGRSPQPADDRPYPQTAQWIAWLFANGDSAGAEALVRQIPPTYQDGALASAAHSLGQDHPSIARYLNSRIESPLLRAQHHVQRSVILSGRGDTLEARTALAEAAATARRDTSWLGNLYAASWDVERYAMGDSITVGDIVRRAAAGRGDSFQMVYQVAEGLSRRRRASEAIPLIDSLLDVAASDPSPRGANVRAALIELRGTRADTLRARAIRDSVEMAARFSPVVGALPGPAHESDHLVWTAVQERDLATMTRALAGALRAARTEHVVENWIQYARATIEDPPAVAQEAGWRDSLVRFGRSVYDTTWHLVASRPPVGRDSVRVALVALMATWDPVGALAVARQLPTARFRERAIATAVVRIAPLDLDAAIAAAEPLTDAVARNVANEALVMQALSAGRLEDAGRFADRTSGGEPCVRSQLAVAWGYRAIGRPEEARRRIRGTIALVDPVWFGIPIVNVHTDSLPAAAVGMTNRVIGDVILLAVALGLRDDVVAWAESQPDVERRAAARIVVVEAMSQWRLGWRPYYPIH